MPAMDELPIGTLGVGSGAKTKILALWKVLIDVF